MPLRFASPADQAYRFPLTIRHLLDSAMQSAPDQAIVYRDKTQYTYRELGRRIGRLASMLAMLGATEGSTVAMMDWDSHRYLESYFAVPMMGAVLQTVNVRLPVPQIAYTLRKAAAEILMVHRDFLPIVEAIRARLPDVKAIVVIGDGEPIDLPGWASGEYEALMGTASPDFDFVDFDENALATTFFTTGTTGDPKCVSFTHRQLVLHALAANGPFGASSFGSGLGIGDVYMPLTPMFHVHAWGLPYIATMLGVKQVYPGRYEPEMILRLRREHRVSFSHGVPTILQMLLAAAGQTGTDLTGWRMIIGGSALTLQLWQAGTDRGMELTVGYGMSETGPMIGLARRDPDDDRPLGQQSYLASVLRTVPLVSARVVDDRMQDVPADGESRGELVLRAPWLTASYGEDVEASADLWYGGWLHTQDVATIDGEGRIIIRDRLKDVVKSGGEWIDSIQLEQMIADVAGVAEVAVIAVPDDRWGERPLAVLVVAPGIAVGVDAVNGPILAAIESGAITRYARLDRIECVAELPRTSVGKVDKKALRRRFAIVETAVLAGAGA